jgi:bacillopeptidase F (M6 metalloprotease family)
VNPVVVDVRQYAAHYVQVADVAGANALNITVTSPAEVGLAPITSPSDTPMWYSNRGDDSNTKLTFAVDLTTATAPTLDYTLWHHIELGWDYGYAMASTDGGLTWDILQTPNMTTDNPHLTAYGPGYSGRAEGWLNEQIDLSAYAGQVVLLRFEMIYDDAVNQPGMFVDSVRVSDPSAGVLLDTNFADFNAPGFNAQGWMLTDNRLPQQVWVQMVTEGTNGATVTRWLHPGGDAIYSATLPTGTSSVTVALSPFAPTTTVSAPLTLAISAAE